MSSPTPTPTAPTPSPTPGETINDIAENAADPAWWKALLGTPLNIAIIVVLAVLIALVLRRMINKFARKIADGTTAANKRRVYDEDSGTDPVLRARRAQRANTVGSLLSSFATIIVAAIAILMVLQEVGINPAPILASAGVAGIAIGFGAQSLVRDYLSGFFIVVEDQYGIGDTVDLGEAIGEVEEVGLRTTRIRDIEGTLWHVPNGEILRVGNQSQGWARAVVDVPVPIDLEEDRAVTIIEAAIKRLMRNPDAAVVIMEPPQIIGIQVLSGASTTYRVFIKTHPNEQWSVARAFRSCLKTEFEHAGVTIALPEQMVIQQTAGAVPSEYSKPADDAGDCDCGKRGRAPTGRRGD